jgi:hypothetical protein
MMNLANIYQEKGLYLTAECIYLEALSVFRGIPGTEVSQATCMMNLGLVWECTGFFKEAERSCLEAVSIFLGIPGTHVEQARCMWNLAHLLFEKYAITNRPAVTPRRL